MNVSAWELNDDVKDSIIGLFNGKLVSIQMLVNKLKKLYLVEKLRKKTFIQPWFSIILLCL